MTDRIFLGADRDPLAGPRFFKPGVAESPESILGAGQHESAGEALLEVVRIRPDFADAHYLLGQLFHAHLNDREQSVRHLKTAEKLYFKNRDREKSVRIRQMLAS